MSTDDQFQRFLHYIFNIPEALIHSLTVQHQDVMLLSDCDSFSQQPYEQFPLILPRRKTKSREVKEVAKAIHLRSGEVQGLSLHQTNT